LVEVPASTVRGAAAKARALDFYTKDVGHDDWAKELGSIVADLERLAEAA
jgi:hypothetical protein